MEEVPFEEGERRWNSSPEPEPETKTPGYTDTTQENWPCSSVDGSFSSHAGVDVHTNSARYSQKTTVTSNKRTRPEEPAEGATSDCGEGGSSSPPKKNGSNSNKKKKQKSKTPGGQHSILSKKSGVSVKDGSTSQYVPRSKHWCFTLNNYTDEDLLRLSSLRSTRDLYLIYGKEVGETGTPHLQGFVSFPSRKRLNQVIQALGQCHCSIARFISQSIEYCKKEGDYTEFGIPPKGKGQRSDLEAFKEEVKNGMRSLEEIREKHSSVYAKYSKFCKEYVRDNEKPAPIEALPLRPWQQDLYEELKKPPDDRGVLFLVDVKGNTGKSWFFRYYNDLHPKDSQIILPGKKMDMAYTLQTGKRVIMFDCPRSKQGDFIQYDFLEEVKNGYVFSGKYEPEVKKFPSPHVVVAMNEAPNYEMLSEDRYIIRML